MEKTPRNREFQIVDQITKTLAGFSLPQAELSIGDDAALVGKDLCCLDILQENVHFSFDYFSYEDLGYKSLAVNLSDLAAMGGYPRYALVGLGLPAKTTVPQISDFYRGMGQLAQKYDCAIVGGDISQSPYFYSTTTVIGKSSGKTILSRSNGKNHDYLLVTHTLGMSALYLKTVKEKIVTPPSLLDRLRQAHLRPIPQLELGRYLLNVGCRCAIDCSDGFLQDVGHILDASELGLKVNTDTIPLDAEAVEFFGRETVLEAALGGGEDFELIFSLKPKDYLKISNQASLPFHIVGYLTEEHPGEIVNQNGQTLERKGFKHFE